MVQTIKFSEFVDGGNLDNDNITVGLKDSANTKFNNPWTFLPPGTTAERPAIAAGMYYKLRLNTSLQQYEYYDPITAEWAQIAATNVFGFDVVTTTPIQMEGNTGYIVDSASIVSLILPELSEIGTIISVSGFGAGGWIINQGEDQSIIIGNMTSTVGVSGSVASTYQSDSLRLLCVEENLTWTTLGGPQGQLEIL